MPICSRFFSLLLCGLLLGNPCLSFGGETPKKPHQVINDLRQRMYVIGETTGRYSDFIDAELMATYAIRAYVDSSTDPAALVERNESGQTPLMAAAFMGYPELVRELLKSGAVKRGIDDTNPQGISAWLYSNIAFRQALWACNPTVFNDVFRVVPLLVTQPYYLESSESPYKKTRSLLEDAGAKADLAQAKLYWLNNCKHQTKTTRKKVQASNDLLDTVLTEGAEALKQFKARKQGGK